MSPDEGLVAFDVALGAVAFAVELEDALFCALLAHAAVGETSAPKAAAAASQFRAMRIRLVNIHITSFHLDVENETALPREPMVIVFAHPARRL
ncbi:hypothetical protein IW967_10100 [Alicyclobacillus mali]|uniref:Secreted protein n=1 Tax=Alicyclobacillus mali (ex Roth et al. 2021) TaxID=1123961 RepID=A0ABS0F4Q1_9BACL|nr:hypothetical protein [Alicyclobacillus mali (ex Roth et al. 2021)]MBF8378211.1 hypothetical protein [Alicyclobacillus mali (ex Roth et al. 2021)]MCL6487527.1 hypothetical protein [Alicyclobacillus mali (ex Roth et al. 2021)]